MDLRTLTLLRGYIEDQEGPIQYSRQYRGFEPGSTAWKPNVRHYASNLHFEGPPKNTHLIFGHAHNGAASFPFRTRTLVSSAKDLLFQSVFCPEIVKPTHSCKKVKHVQINRIIGITPLIPTKLQTSTNSPLVFQLSRPHPLQ